MRKKETREYHRMTVTVAVKRKTVVTQLGKRREIEALQISEPLPEAEADALLFYVGAGSVLLNQFAFLFEAEGNEDDSLRLREDATARMRSLLYGSHGSAAELRRLSDPVVADLMKTYCFALVDTAMRSISVRDGHGYGSGHGSGYGYGGAATAVLDFFDPSRTRNSRVLYRGVQGTLASISTSEMSATFVSTTSSVGVAAIFGAKSPCCMFRLFVQSPSSPQIDVLEFRDDEVHHEEETILCPGFQYRYSNFIEERLISFANQLNIGISVLNADATLTTFSGTKDSLALLETVKDSFFDGEHMRSRPSPPDAIDVALALSANVNSVAVLGSLVLYSFEPHRRGMALLRKFRQFASQAHDPAHVFIDVRARFVSSEEAVKDRIRFGCVYRLVEHWDGIDDDLAELVGIKLQHSSAREKVGKEIARVESLVSTIHKRLGAHRTGGVAAVHRMSILQRLLYENMFFDLTEKDALSSLDHYLDCGHCIRDVYAYPQLGNPSLRHLLEIARDRLKK